MSLMFRIVKALAVAVLLTGCAGLQPLPVAKEVTCGAVTDLAELARCIGAPDQAPRESGVRSTLRVAYGDLTRRLMNQSASHACNRRPWPGFRWVEHEVAGAAPLRAFIHEGTADQPVIMVVHGIFDSNSNRYVRYLASALAAQGFGVVVPDMRWHGCLYSAEWISTVGIDEATDLVLWSRWLKHLHPRPVGLLGVSLGGLDVINAMARVEAVEVFDAGAVAISPPANMPVVVERLDQSPLPRDPEGRWLVLHYFRTTLLTRIRRASIPIDRKKPFASLLEWVAENHPPPFPGSATALMVEVEPVRLLPLVRRPLLIVAAKNDPVMTDTSSTALREAAATLTHVAVIETSEGGHAGHLGRDPQWVTDMLFKFFTHAPFIAVRP